MSVPLFLFPGLAADGRLFDCQSAALDRVEVPTYPEPLPDESLADYCQRWAKSIDLPPEFYLGGVSFGGAVVLELSKWLQPKGTILISSNRSARSIPKTFRAQVRAMDQMSDRVLRFSLKQVGVTMFRMRETLLSPGQIKTLEAMAAECDLDFFRWAAKAIATWNYDFNPEDFRSPLHQIHGEHDFIIPLEKHYVDRTIAGGKHLITFTHAEDVNGFIQGVFHGERSL